MTDSAISSRHKIGSFNQTRSLLPDATMLMPRILPYPIPGNDEGGILHTYGNPTANNIVLCCPGFPDDHRPFTPLARRLAEENCFVGITCYPGFDYSTFRKSKFNGYKRQGYSFDEVAMCIREATKRLFEEYCNNASVSERKKDEDGIDAIDSNIPHNNESNKPQFTVILHDWGVVPGLMFTNNSLDDTASPHVPHKVVLLDVLTWPHLQCKDLPLQTDVAYPLKPSRLELIITTSYREALAISFAMLLYISELVGLITLVILYGVVMLLQLNPTRHIDNVLVNRNSINPFHLVYQCYPYFYMFRNIINKSGFANASRPLDLFKTPILYIYGANKNVMFHDWRSLALLEREEREGASACRVVRMEDAGHWMFVQKTEACLKEIQQFLNEDVRTGGKEEKKDAVQSKL